MATFTVDANRFPPSAPTTDNAEKHRVSVSHQIIPNARPPQPDNGDSAAYADRRASFTTGLKHDPVTGCVDAAAVATFEAALAQPRNLVVGALEALDQNLHLSAGRATRKRVNPVAGRAFAVVGGDPQQYGEAVMPPAPRFASEELSFEIVKNCWMAHLRDVPFSQYESSALAIQTATELTTFRNAAIAERVAAGLPAERLAPVDGVGTVTPRLLFRGLSPGEDKGPTCHSP